MVEHGFIATLYGHMLWCHLEQDQLKLGMITTFY